MMGKSNARPVDDERIDSDNAGMPTQRAGPEGQAEGPAEVAVRAWQRLAEQLSPLIGERGFRVLYARSIHLTQGAFPCLSVPSSQADMQESFLASLKQSLECHPALAEDAHRALLGTFTGLLSALIGEVLTARFVQEAPPGGSTDGHKAGVPQ